MMKRNLEGERKPNYTVLIFLDDESGEELARLPEEGTLPTPEVGESVHLSTMELVDKEGEVIAQDKDTQEYTVESRSYDYSLLEYDGDEEGFVEGDQLYTFISFKVSEAETDTGTEE